MKTLFTVFTLLVVSIVAQAEVAKPKNTIQPAKGVASVEGLNFNYTVYDRGWAMIGNANTGAISALKSFMIQYDPTDIGDADIVELSSKLGLDSSNKCGELGNMELSSDSNKLSAEYTSTLRTNVSGKAHHSNLESSLKMSGAFVCHVHIDSLKNAQ